MRRYRAARPETLHRAKCHRRNVLQCELRDRGAHLRLQFGGVHRHARVDRQLDPIRRRRTRDRDGHVTSVGHQIADRVVVAGDADEFDVCDHTTGADHREPGVREQILHERKTRRQPRGGCC